MAIATREASPAHLLLKIESFSLLDKCGVDKYESQEFDAGNNKWRLVIYPNGTEKSGDFVSVCLAISGTGSLPENWEVNAVFTIFILNQISGNYHHTIGNTRRFFGSKTEWVVPDFISKKDLITPSNGFLIDDRCLFGAEVFAIDNINVVTRCLSLKDAKVPHKHEIKISDFSKLKDKIWYSEKFTAGGYKWKIILYPNGVEDEVGRSVSIFLEYVPFDNKNSDVRVKAHFTISIKHSFASHRDTKYTCSNRWFGASSLSWGWPSFISRDLMKYAFGGFIVDGACLLEIEISVQAVSQ